LLHSYDLPSSLQLAGCKNQDRDKSFNSQVPYDAVNRDKVSIH
jgi:hypothetical protein